jgi:hypothetical protein
MSRRASRSVTVALLAGIAISISVIGALVPGPAQACLDSGTPPVGPREPFDAGPRCTAVRDTCEIYRAVCDVEAGPATRAGGAGCSVAAPVAPTRHALASLLAAAIAIMIAVRRRAR